MSINMKARKNRNKDTDGTYAVSSTFGYTTIFLWKLSQHVLRNINADIIHGSTISR